MSIPAIEYVRAPATDALKNNWSGGIVYFQDFIDILKDVPGFINAYFGQHIEDNDYFILVIVWETVEHHLAYQASADYGRIHTAAAPFVGGPLSVTHIRPAAPIAGILDAPVVEFATLSLKERANRDRLEGLVREFVERGVVVREGRALAGTWGWSHEREADVWVLLAWPSVEAHSEGVSAAANPDVTELVVQLHELAGNHMDHVSLTKLK